MKLLPRMLGLAVLSVVVVAVYHFLTDDNGAIQARARAAACSGKGSGCTARLTRMLRTPLWSDLDFSSSRGTAQQAIAVRCMRASYLWGELQCVRR